jgi:hypothetical protein
MNTMFKMGCIATLLALPVQAMAAVDAPKCITRAELRTGIAYVMPAAVESVVTKCGTTLPADAYLAVNGPALLDRYKAESVGNDDAVATLMERFIPANAMDGVDEKATKAIVDAVILVAIQKGIKPEYCADISEGLSLIDPLPAANMIGLLEFVAVKINNDNARKAAANGLRKDGKTGRTRDKPFLCPPVATADAG